VQHFINAKHDHEIIFTRNATESINLVAHSFGELLSPGDTILITAMEHHANIVPWQLVRDRKGTKLDVAPIDDNGDLIWESFEQKLNHKVKLVAVPHISNALGTVNPIEKIIAAAHARNIPVLIDGCQAVPHRAVDVQALDADFYVFSGHKLYGPSGIGVLYGKESLLNRMPPFLGGGEMIREVTFEKTTFNDLPFKFEAGTPAIAEAIALGAAIDYLEIIGMEHIHTAEAALLAYATTQLKTITGLRLIGTAREKSAILSFIIEGTHPSDVGMILDREGIAVRTGHHCAMPVMQRFNISGTIRASLGLYTTPVDIDALIRALLKAKELLS
jgi:cysteine desulfurase/selenocysteine lyase